MADPIIVSDNQNADRAARLHALIDECIRRRNGGELLTDERVIRDHPDLLPELAEELRKLQLIEQARRAAQDDGAHAPHPQEPAATIAWRRDQHDSSNLAGSLRVVCPYCRHPSQVLTDTPLINVGCSRCGRQFHVAADKDHARQVQSARTIAHFEIIARLGTGGFGTVWKARDTRLDRIVAVKTPRQGQLAEDEVDNFLHEARVAAQLKHPHIVGVHEIGRDGDLVYIVSDLIQGSSLSQWRKDLPLTFRETAELCATIASALHYAHQEGVVHRDLKPANVLIDADGQPHLTDFGLAKWEADELTVTLDGRILGTPAYMPPEQARGDSRLSDRRADVYSLGVILFELLTDELPFRGQALTLIHQVVHDEPPSPRKLNVSVPRDLETICLKCLDKEPDRRYATAQQLADELRRYCHGQPILARPISTAARVWRWSRRHPIVPGLLGSLGLVMALVYVLGWFWFQDACTNLDQELTARALTSNVFAAASVADAAGLDLQRRYEIVEQTARQPRLARLLDQFASDPELAALLAQLSDPQLDAETHERLRATFAAHPKQRELQDWIVQQSNDQHVPIFAWFVLDAAGLQLARNPIEDWQTIGRSYAWRSYFHHQPTDRPEDWRAMPDERLRATRISQVFVSRFTNQWVVVVSTPVLEDDRFLGVVGMMIELGKFVELPGRETEQPAGSGASRFAVLVDARDGNQGQILQHPLYDALSGSTRRELLDLSQKTDYAVVLGQWTTSSDYRDPFSRASPDYARRWLAAQAPVEVRSQPTGLIVIVQEGYDDLIGAALGQLKSTLILLSIATVGLVAIFVAPLWWLVLRTLK